MQNHAIVDIRGVPGPSSSMAIKAPIVRPLTRALSPLLLPHHLLTHSVPSFLPTSLPPDKNFDEDDSVDGGRSTSSSKPVSASGRKAVSMGSFRKPSSGSSAKSAGQTLTRRSAVSGYRASRCSTSRRTLVFATLKYFLIVSTGKDAASAGAVDEEDFLRAFEDVPTVQVHAHAHSSVSPGRQCT